MELFEQIRKTHEREGLSVRALAERFGTHRRTVRQALLSALPPPRKVQRRVAPALGPWKPTIDRWLAEDRAMPKKQRHTARRVWERLVAECGADVAESTVRRYVREARRQIGVAIAEVSVPQTHPLGEEAEVDFGQISFLLDGVLVEGWMFVLRLSASGRGFHRIYLNQAQQVFLDGHVRAFAHFGGVPETIRYDNLKPAVVRVMKGRDRKETERFIAMRSHYGFDSFFCQPGPDGAHEKGGVEGEVGRFRRRHLVPVPRVGSMAELNDLVAKGDATDDHRRIFGRSATVGEHFAFEKGALRPLPAEPFDPSLVHHYRVDPKSRVCVRQCFYSVPVRYAGRRVEVRLGAETVQVLDGAQVVAHHQRAVHKGSEVLVLDHYLEVLFKKPGAFKGASALVAARRSGAFGAVHERFWLEARRRLGDRGGTKALIEVLLAHRSIASSALEGGMTAALELGSLDPAVVILEARKLASASEQAPIVPMGAALSHFDRPPPSIDHYDELLEA